MADKAAKVEREFVSASAAARIIGVSPKAIHDLVARNLISVRRIPGRLPTYSRADCARVATDSIFAATATIATASK